MKWKVDKQSPAYDQYAAIRKFRGTGAGLNLSYYFILFRYSLY